MCIRSRIKGQSKSNTSLRRREGKLSDGQLVVCRCLTASEREERGMGANYSKAAGWRNGGEEGGYLWMSRQAKLWTLCQ